MNTEKKGIALLAQICAAKGVEHVVISPGSRNAPLTIAFTCQESFEIINIPDERSAAFFALGIAQATNVPVVLICTSGSAALNYAPAIAEAFYQRVPLLVLSSDRPEELIDQGEGQSIRQFGIYDNFIRASYRFPQLSVSDNELNYARRIISEGLDKCIQPIHGPVHINVPLDEPLYGRSSEELKDFSPSTSMSIDRKISSESEQIIKDTWDRSEKVMVLLGGHSPDPVLNKLLSKFNLDPYVAVLTETNANVHGLNYSHHIDLALSAISTKDQDYYAPDLLITFGENIISKRIKAWIREHKPKEHWHVDPEMKHYDTFQCLTHHIPIDPLEFLRQFEPKSLNENSTYSDDWKCASQEALEATLEFTNTAPYSDLKVLGKIHEQIPSNYRVHYANSTSVRYAQLFPHREDLKYFANRGTSGIDGCTSTAAGHALASKSPTLLITGDMAFFYDSNALWNHHLSEHLRIIMINNDGGNIFRIIDGPESTGQLEQHFEAKHNTGAEHLAKTYNVPYYFCDDMNGIADTLPKFFGKQNGRPAILEIKTPNEISAETLRGLFKALEQE